MHRLSVDSVVLHAFTCRFRGFVTIGSLSVRFRLRYTILLATVIQPSNVETITAVFIAGHGCVVHCGTFGEREFLVARGCVSSFSIFAVQEVVNFATGCRELISSTNFSLISCLRS